MWQEDKPMSLDWLVLGLGRSGIGQQVQESRWKGTEDGKGEELSLEVHPWSTRPLLEVMGGSAQLPHYFVMERRGAAAPHQTARY